MIMVQMQCGSCRGVFSVSKGFFNGESNPVFCTFCGEKQLINGGEFEYNRGVLDNYQRDILRTYLQITTPYRQKEKDACFELGKSSEQKIPDMKANAEWWALVDNVIEDIIQEL